MDSLGRTSGSGSGSFVGQWLGKLQSHATLSLAVGIIVLAAGAATVSSRSLQPKSESKKVAVMPGKIPYVSNTLLYMSDLKTFIEKATNALRTSKIASFYLGPTKVYLITGARSISILFRTTPSLNSDKLMLMVLKGVYGLTPHDLSRFEHDRSGRLAKPAPGTENIPEIDRLWHGYHHVLHENLAQTSATNWLGRTFQRLFSAAVEKDYPLGESHAVQLFAFGQSTVARAAIEAIVGLKIFELEPDFLSLFWEFDEVAGTLVWGLPQWVNRTPYDRRKRFKEACAKYMRYAWDNFDWDGPDADADWEPCFGSRFARELAKWLKKSGFEDDTVPGLMGVTTIYASNSNTIPMATWVMMELIQNKSLFEAVREEVAAAYYTTETGERILDAQKLTSLPLLQSIYVEALRLHVSVMLTREIAEPITVDGYVLEKGSLLQAPSEIAHRQEDVWAAEGHPASEFWAERHITYVDVMGDDGKVRNERQFSMAGRASDWVPYGGGVTICPGRFFAKQEIMLVVATLVSRFDIEFIEWITLEGQPSDRPAQNDSRWAGGVGMPPDRDMKVRWSRLW